jgi:YVTN family beta-propeller protein
VVVDVARHEAVESIEVERGELKPVGVVASPDGTRIYVANGLASTVSVLDARTLRLVGRVPVGRRPWGIALSR